MVMKEMTEKEIENFFDDDIISRQRKELKQWLRKKITPQ